MANVTRYEWKVHGTRGHWDVRMHVIVDGGETITEDVVRDLSNGETAKWLVRQLNLAYQMGRDTGTQEALERTMKAMGEL